MIKKTITYIDYNGNENTEDFYFHLGTPELAMMDVEIDGGLHTYLKEIVKTERAKDLLTMFQSIISKAYGIRSQDGKSFYKDEQQTNEFMHSAAYDELFLSFVSDAGSAAQFIAGMLPANLAEKLDVVDLPDDEEPNYSHEDLVTMSDEKFARVAGSDIRKMSRDHLVAAMDRKNRQPA